MRRPLAALLPRLDHAACSIPVALTAVQPTAASCANYDLATRSRDQTFSAVTRRKQPTLTRLRVFRPAAGERFLSHT